MKLVSVSEVLSKSVTVLLSSSRRSTSMRTLTTPTLSVAFPKMVKVPGVVTMDVGIPSMTTSGFCVSGTISTFTVVSADWVLPLVSVATTFKVCEPFWLSVHA
ncbi:hypothetical protein D3875_13785 [Deinococcus cavernae]|uniref:Uncharacterized protein n=1 Tax=Deinococcus cavernae TaxID=2320857 RepID=A0A418V8P6_9DEIO|nr:hypothetical protein D3875_13785 [Deinococcus cavernae]